MEQALGSKTAGALPRFSGENGSSIIRRDLVFASNGRSLRDYDRDSRERFVHRYELLVASSLSINADSDTLVWTSNVGQADEVMI